MRRIIVIIVCLSGLMCHGQIVNPGGGGGGSTLTPNAIQYATSTSATRAATSLDVQNLLTPPVTGASAEYPMLDGSGTTVTDVSGNGRNATFGSGSNAPTWAPYGVVFGGTGISSTDSFVTTPITTYGTVYVAECTGIFPQTSGIGGGGPGQQFPTLIGPTTASAGISLLSVTGATDQYNSVVPTAYNIAGGSPVTSGISAIGNCHTYGFSAGSSTDHITVDGAENPFYASQGASGSLVALTGGATYEMGNSTFLTGRSLLRGMISYVMFYPTAHTVSQMAQTSKYIQNQIALRPQFPQYPILTNANTPQFVPLGDSLTAGYLGSAPWTNSLTLNNSYTVTNWGFAGMLALDVCSYAEQRWISSVVTGQTTVHIWAGTNDLAGGFTPQQAWGNVAACISKAKRYGARVIVATMIDRNGISSSTTNAYNAIIRTQYKTAGADYLDDLAMFAPIGANGASTNTACFQGDETHLTGPGTGTCGFIGSTDLSGYGAVAVMTSGAVNTLDGSSQSNPDQTASNAFVSAYANNYVIQTPTAAATYSLVDCQGQTSPRTVVNGSGVFAITASAINSQTITGSSSIIAHATAIFSPVLTSTTAAGCFWVRTQ